jgi:Glycoside-hydrolase family GH114
MRDRSQLHWSRWLGTLAAAIAIGGAVNASSVATASSPHLRLPPANGRFDYQIGGAYHPLASVRIVDRDHTSNPAPGVYNICYINAFQTQGYQDAWWRKHHPTLYLHTASGKPLQDPGWPGEYILDTSTAAKRAALATIEGRWLTGCERKGFNAVEPDNLDSNTRSHHQLTQSDDFAFAKILVKRAHADGLAIAQKNDAEQSHAGRHAIGFDFAIAEECQVYSECASYTKVYGNQVYEIEYTDNPRADFTRACMARGKSISIILRDRDVTPRGARAYRYEAC